MLRDWEKNEWMLARLLTQEARNRQEENYETCSRQDKRALGRERGRQDRQKEGNRRGKDLSCAWKTVDGEPGFPA